MSLFNYNKVTEHGSAEANNAKIIVNSIFGALFVVVALVLVVGSWTVVGPTEQNPVIRIGKMDRTLAPGFHWKLPWFDDVITMDVSVQKIEVQASAASADLQVVTTNLAVQYELDETAVGTLYVQYKKNVRSKVIDPAIQDAVKASTALFNADELITKRAEVKDNIFALLNERLSEANVVLKNVDIINFDFSESFNVAIEEKVTAEQNASREENNLRKAEFVAEQRIAEARGEAEAIRIQAQAIQSQGGKDYVNLQWIEAWKEGGAKVPTTIIGEGGNSFLFNIK